MKHFLQLFQSTPSPLTSRGEGRDEGMPLTLTLSPEGRGKLLTIVTFFLLLLTFGMAHAEERKILYYRNPMGLPDTSPVPKKDQMGMDYIPVYAEDGAEDEKNPKGTVTLSPEKIQRIGVKTENVQKRALSGAVRMSGVSMFDETKLLVVAPKFSGWIEEFNTVVTGSHVAKKGDVLMKVYSPELIEAQRNYIVAMRLFKGADGDVGQSLDRQVAGALKQLDYFGISSTDRKKLEKDGNILRTVTIYAPADAIILEQNLVEGEKFEAGQAIFRMADISDMWIDASIAESDIGKIAVGDKAAVRLKAFPNRSFEGTVHHIHPVLDATTRTGRVKFSVKNPDGVILSGMYADVEFGGGDSGDKLTVPSTAIIDTGKRQVAIVDMGEGRFAPKPVKTGVRNGDYVEVTEGLMEGDKVVTRANFLIDAESNLKAALEAFAQGGDKP